MTMLYALCAAFAAILALQSIFAYLHHRQLQRTIDRLTDKLMARDYGEYKRHDHTLMREEKPGRKPISFYDDTSIDIDDEVQ